MNVKILMCGNSGVFPGMLLAALSITKHTESKIELFIGTMDLSDINPAFTPITEDMRAKLDKVLKRKNPDSYARIYDFGDSFRRDLIHSKNLGTSYTPYTLIRLFANEIAEADDKLLYLDTDVMALGNIDELYAEDIEKYHIAGVRDFMGKYFFTPLYLNAGVILFNMKKMRKDRIFEKCVKLCNEKKLFLSDQHALNRYASRRLILNHRFNEQRETESNTLIRHFAMRIRLTPKPHKENIKPWHEQLVKEKLKDRSFDDIYEEYALLQKGEA